MTTARLVVVSAGLSQPSSTRLLADRLAAAAQGRIESAGRPVEVEVVELRSLAHALADTLLTGFPTGELADALDKVERADALIAVSPIFSASYSGLFKTFFDVLPKEALAGKPVLIAATAGTARHSLALEHALRPLFSYLHAVVVPTAVFAATEDFGRPGLQDRVERAADELATMVVGRPTSSASSSGRPATSGTPSTSASGVPFTPFEQLLRGR
jgi:FMN reductase